MNNKDLQTILELHKLWIEGNEKGQKADLSWADLSGADLSMADLSGANLRGADLRGSDLSMADLSGANLRGADLRGSNLTEANLSGADLSRADLREANLREADLRWANLSRANLREADFYVYQGSRHIAYFSAKDSMLRIGCEYHSIEHWIEEYEEIGKINDYSKQEIQEYFIFINSFRKLK